jgi:hypothetical protein
MSINKGRLLRGIGVMRNAGLPKCTNLDLVVIDSRGHYHANHLIVTIRLE